VGFDNKSAVRRILIGEKEGEALKTEIIKTRTALLAVVERLYDSLEREPIDGVKLDTKAVEYLKKELILELPQNSLHAKNDKSFTELTFGNLSVEEANLMLRKFESDARVACSQVINYLDSNMSRGAAIVYDKIDVLYMPTKYAIYLGETYEAKIALGQMSSQLEFSVNINENNLPMDGMTAIYRVEPKLIGTHRYSATINVKNPRTGEMERIRKDFQYEVLEPRKK
jgi:hypothetical protein